MKESIRDGWPSPAPTDGVASALRQHGADRVGGIGRGAMMFPPSTKVGGASAPTTFGVRGKRAGNTEPAIPFERDSFIAIIFAPIKGKNAFELIFHILIGFAGEVVPVPGFVFSLTNVRKYKR